MAKIISAREAAQLIPDGATVGLAGMGLFLFLRSGWADYMFFRSAFAFLDYEKAGSIVFLENLLMLVFWAFIGERMAKMCMLTL